MAAQRVQFEEFLTDIKSAIIHMGEEVGKAISLSVLSLKNSDHELARQVIAYDEEINKMEEKIDVMGTRLIATQQPVAKDLRRILIAFKIAADLERMADLAVDISRVTIRLGDHAPTILITDIMKMSEIAMQMTEESITAFTKEDIDLAYKTAKLDDAVDDLHSRNMHQIFTHVAGDPISINRAMLLAFVSRYLERIADHATNIGESVVYLVKGSRPDLNQ
jgi:phosphate transport system protein